MKIRSSPASFLSGVDFGAKEILLANAEHYSTQKQCGNRIGRWLKTIS
ncbi:MAG: hypothetical protein IPL86_16285 [Flavobacteriales bacterium]|nr:hypothetical protein [Flavobacteriales bacterium]